MGKATASRACAPDDKLQARTVDTAEMLHTIRTIGWWPRREERAFAHPARVNYSHIHIGAERIILDEFAARLDHIAHQLGEDVVGLVDLLDPHLQERALVG